MGEMVFPISTSFNKSLRVESRPERLTGEAGSVLCRELLDRTRIMNWLEQRLKDPRRAEKVTYQLRELLQTTLLLRCQGFGDQDDADALRLDPALRLSASCSRGTTPLADDHVLASQPTLSRLVASLSGPTNLVLLREAICELAGRRIRSMRGGHRKQHLVIDIDSLPIEVHGQQPGAAYNGHYHQQMYHPLVASIGETGDLLDVCLRRGNAHTADGSIEFLEGLLDRVEDGVCQIALVRMDAGFPSEPLLRHLEDRGTPYVARIRSNKALDRLAQPYLKRPPGRPPCQPRTWFHELAYQASSWSRARRVVLVVLERPDQLFVDHFYLLTSLSAMAVPGEDLLAMYRERGCAEKWMGELMDVLRPALSSSPRRKSHYRGQSLPSREAPPIDAFARNEATLTLCALAYNVLHVGRALMAQATGQGWSLGRFRDRVLKAPARVLVHGRYITLVLAATAAEHWTKLWPRLERLHTADP